MSNPIILDWYNELAEIENHEKFARAVAQRYTEGTLLRLLGQRHVRTREAALVALRLRGSMNANTVIAKCLRDPAPRIVEAAEQALWAIWYRADTPAHNQELQRIAELIGEQEFAQALKALNALVAKAPKFAEAYNQRAILHWQWGNYRNSIEDCQKVLRLNPIHFAAAAGMAQCFMQLRKPVEALKSYRLAQRIHPRLDGVAENISELEDMLREQRRRREDRK